MSIVSDTGPLIALAKADALHVVRDLFGFVRIPVAVERELLVKPSRETDRLSAALGDFVRVVPQQHTNQPETELLRSLDDGERQAICLALSRGGVLAVDDRAARTAARSLGLTVTGTAGIVVAAHRAGLVAGVRDTLDLMRREGYYLSDALLDEAARQAGE